MKKLLSAVTSFVMGVSLMTSAFASSVSAAGSYKTVSQPNVSMDEVIDVAANRNAADADIIFDFGNHTANPGDRVKVDVLITTNGNPISAIDAVLKQDSPLTVSNIGSESKAFGKPIVSNLTENAWSVITLGGDKNDTPMVAENGTVVVSVGYQIPADCPDGKYEIGFGDKCMVFKDSTAFTYKVAKSNGFITVGNPTDDPQTTTTKKVTTTTTKQPSDQPADGDIIFDFGNHTAKPGDKVKVNVTITPNGNPISAIDVVLKQDSPITLTNIGSESKAFGKTIVSNLPENAWSVITLGGDKNDTPMVAEDGSVVVTLGYQVPTDCPDGVYEIGFGDKCMVFKDNTAYNYSVSKVNGFITVGDATVTSTTNKVTTTT